MALKILYIVGDGSQHENKELRWSLRSLEKFALDDVEPVIVGSVPEWFKGDALEVEDTTERKEKNIMAKILAAIDAKLVEGEFQISADDHIWLCDQIFSVMPIYYREPILPEYIGGNNYAKALDNTRKALLLTGLPAMNTTVHCNQWAHSEDAKWIRELFRLVPDFGEPYGLVSWAAWPNLYLAQQLGRTGALAATRPIIYKHDVKIGATTGREVQRLLKTEPIISFNDEAFACPDFVAAMNDMFQKKSRWEK